ncbi:MAG: ABC transporter ATP-binding protein [Pseudoxanthomonas sp.]
MSDLLLEAHDLGKKYARSLRSSLRYGMRDVVAEAVGMRHGEELREQEFWALKDINFQLRRGECLAVLGTNGAGKSTLLKVLSGILAPDCGYVKREGRLEKMIELLAGMAQSLSGRENVMLRSRLLGLSKQEAARRLEEVVDFAELGEHIDMPVMFYSSGMKARLGFATTVVMSPDILLIDEVLAVGDLGFRMKCYERVDQMRRSSAVILVTHAMNQVSRMATSGLVLHKGRPQLLGSTQEAIACYQELSGMKGKAKESAFHPEAIRFSMLADSMPLADDACVVRYGQAVTLRARHSLDVPVRVSAILHEANGPTVADWHSGRSGFMALPGREFEVELGSAQLCPGYYQFVLVGFGLDGTQHFLSQPLRFQVTGDYLGATRVQPLGIWTETGDVQ